MKKITVLFLFFLLAPLSYSQFMDRFEALNETNIKGYATPFATSFGLAMNSGSIGDADLPTLFGFGFSLRFMYMLIPDDQKTFTPSFSQGYNTEPVASIYGDKGGAFIGPGGYQVTPPGLNQSGIPMAVPQVTFAAFGTELLIRFIPKIKVFEEEELSMFGVGLRHEVSQYIPVIPVNVAVGVLYNKFDIGDLMKSNNLAFNIMASKTFAVITPYFGLQIENSDLEVNYTYSPDNPLLEEQEISTKLEGENSFRAVLGFELGLGFLALNADVSFSKQTVLGAGLTFGF